MLSVSGSVAGYSPGHVRIRIAFASYYSFDKMSENA